MANEEWGPLAALIGDWQGQGGLDTAYAHASEKVLDTPYTEKVSMKPFGPVDNGRQHLYGLDYKTAMWRGSEENPFHTEVGYWLWDAATGEVLRGFVVPRGITVLAGAIGVAADATEFTLSAETGGDLYSIAENQYLRQHASTRRYEVTITNGADAWSYHETTTLKMDEFPDLFPHVDHNTLTRA
jgi:hypothetical protein